MAGELSFEPAEHALVEEYLHPSRSTTSVLAAWQGGNGSFAGNGGEIVEEFILVILR
jgi:hypothetical protein